jgi:hypothetical protein
MPFLPADHDHGKLNPATVSDLAQTQEYLTRNYAPVK